MTQYNSVRLSTTQYKAVQCSTVLTRRTLHLLLFVMFALDDLTEARASSATHYSTHDGWTYRKASQHTVPYHTTPHHHPPDRLSITVTRNTTQRNPTPTHTSISSSYTAGLSTYKHTLPSIPPPCQEQEQVQHKATAQHQKQSSRTQRTTHSHWHLKSPPPHSWKRMTSLRISP